jgi:hypothetical protein
MGKKKKVNLQNDIQGNSSVPPEHPNLAAQQPIQTQQKGHIKHP